MLQFVIIMRVGNSMKIKKEETIQIRPETYRKSKYSVNIDLKEQRILNYAIYKKQSNKDSVSFTLQELNAFYKVDFGSARKISHYITALRNFGFVFMDEENEEIVAMNAFSLLHYKEGVFTFKFTDVFLPAVNKTKRYLQLGFAGIQNFRCRFSLYLYNWLKDNMFGNITVKENISLETFRNIFLLEETQYKNNGNFKLRVWEPAMQEINKFTGYRINIVAHGRGPTMRFTIYRLEDEIVEWKKERPKKEFKCYMDKSNIDFGCTQCERVNQCPLKLKISPIYTSIQNVEELSNFEMNQIMNDYFFMNPKYNLYLRINNGIATDLERRYYDHILAKRGITELSVSAEELQQIVVREIETTQLQLSAFNEGDF